MISDVWEIKQGNQSGREMKTVGNLFTQMVNFLEQRLMTKMNKTKQCFTGSVETALWDKIPPPSQIKKKEKNN